ncbi:hypothetical protein J7443_13705 [Tropicibacter sp. R15_0]|uniref:hypothetical protein n=1 Tax=Tropicibacter sp. R15_0 TaxID=2821101 RepID=UPI001ADCD555|nr:hypothetical protein [Tropicibacter sp. R15_0]MBO9466294.1 hypothetical protein [Tropicibacter sp. R15_0]
MRKVVQLKSAPFRGVGKRETNVLEELDLYWGCISYAAPPPKFTRARYVAPDNLWTHDHCQFCNADFFEGDDDGKGTLGWIADDPGPDVPMKSDKIKVMPKSGALSSPSNLRIWVCDTCHDIVSRYLDGNLHVDVKHFREIPGSWEVSQ